MFMTKAYRIMFVKRLRKISSIGKSEEKKVLFPFFFFVINETKLPCQTVMNLM